MTDIYERARFEDLFADIAARVRKANPDVSEDTLRSIEQEVRNDWAGLKVRIGKRLVHDRERIKEMVASGTPERTARYKVRGK